MDVNNLKTNLLKLEFQDELPSIKFMLVFLLIPWVVLTKCVEFIKELQ